MDKIFSVSKEAAQSLIENDKKRIAKEISNANIDFPRCIISPIDYVELEKFISMDSSTLHDKIKSWFENLGNQLNNPATGMLLYQICKNYFDNVIDLLFYLTHASLCTHQIVEFINKSERTETCN